MYSNNSFILDCDNVNCLINFLDIFDSWKLINSCKTLLNNKKIFNIRLPYVKYLRKNTVIFFDKKGKLIIVPKVKHIDYSIVKILRVYKIDYLLFFNKLIQMKYKYKYTKKIMKIIIKHVNHVELCTLIPNSLVFELFHSYYHIYNKQYILFFNKILDSLHNLDYLSFEKMNFYVQILIDWFISVKTTDNKFTNITKFSLIIMISHIVIKTKFIDRIDTLTPMSNFIDSLSTKISEFTQFIHFEYNIPCKHIIDDNIISKLSNLQLQISHKLSNS